MIIAYAYLQKAPIGCNAPHEATKFSPRDIHYFCQTITRKAILVQDCIHGNNQNLLQWAAHTVVAQKAWEVSVSRALWEARISLVALVGVAGVEAWEVARTTMQHAVQPYASPDVSSCP